MISNQKKIRNNLNRTLISMLVLSVLAFGQGNSLRKEVEAVYARRQKAILEKDFALLKSDETDNYTEKSKDGSVRARKQADAEADQLFTMVKEVFTYTIKVAAVEAGKNNEIIVDSGDNGEFSFVGRTTRRKSYREKENNVTSGFADRVAS